MGTSGIDTARRAPARLSPGRRILLLTLGVALAGMALYWCAVEHLPSAGLHAGVPWLVWVGAFAAAEVFVVHVQLKRDSHSFSLTDLVLAAGLVLLAPGSLVTAQLLGAGMALVLHRRQWGVKLAFNLAQYGTEHERGDAGLRRVHRTDGAEPAPGTGWRPSWRRGGTMTANSLHLRRHAACRRLAQPRRAAPHAGALAALRAGHGRRRTARGEHRRAEPGRDSVLLALPSGC